jgi:choline dehydrogenase-like flavoprotein
VSSQQEIIKAFVELQLFHLSPPNAPLIDDPAIITQEAQAYILTLPNMVQAVFPAVTDHINGTARHLKGKDFPALNLKEREQVLDDLWGDTLWHDLVSIVAKIGWLVIHSRQPARQRVGFSFDRRPEDAGVNPVDVPEPARADLKKKYDVCVIGSGAGGSVMAGRIGAKGKSVILLDEGKWISPKDYPQRDDKALMAMYRNAGVQPALPTVGTLLKPGGATFMTVLQARVFGGGPVINNAIHFPIAKETADQWTANHEFPVSWNDLSSRLNQVKADLGVSATETEHGTGERSRIFQRGAKAAGLTAEFLETAIHKCIGCGGCNVGCVFGLKTGGAHGNKGANGPRSYLMRAIDAQAGIAPEIQATRLHPGFLSRKIDRLQARDKKNEKDIQIEAKAYVVSAGPIHSSKLLRNSFIQVTGPVGHGISANIVMPVFAIMPADIGQLPNPGLEMCYYVRQDGRLLESWFHFPGSLTTALPGWLDDHVRIMGSYRRLVACGVVVPSGNRGIMTLPPGNDLVLSISDAELKLMIAGVISAADLYFEAGALEVIPATARPCSIRADAVEGDIKRFRQSIRGPADLTLGTAHPQGGNTIGRHASKSVVGPDFHTYDFDNLFVADASLFPAGCGVNPQMTAMALSHLAADKVLSYLG